MALFDPYPERTGSDVDGQTFDYIVVGGGTAGCVIASRLTEPEPDASGATSRGPPQTVLVLEKGRVQDEWADSLGPRDWAWHRVVPYFSKIERAVAHPSKAS